ncbi:phosphatase PAP2 family protein [Methylobacterium durans]|uniref:phosphatase PAP2 family protein n=1 Tax=Methylobacterium durans TaxID=2202825 RepID=UPI002AFEBD86|nr:phosphatase PAP2 family protein [Methylobacterium durans]MEA1833631.1 phosphatase PAP2 family protein [Methylobacterium durans]
MLRGEEPGHHDPIDRSFGLEALDVALALRLARGKDRLLVRALGGLSEIGSQQALLALAAGTLAYGLFTRDARGTRTGARMLGAHIAASLVKSTVKRLTHRTRPDLLIDDGLYARGWFGPNEGSWQSFPSGHVAVSVAVSRAVMRAYPEWRGRACAGAAFVTALQVLRGSHFPTDVAAGAAIGALAEAASEAAFRAAARPPAAPATESPAPAGCLSTPPGRTGCPRRPR